MNDTSLPVSDTRKAQLFVAIVRGIAAGASVWFVYLAVKQTYRAGVIVSQPGLSVAKHVTEPPVFWLLLVTTTGLAYVLGGAGLYAALSARLTSVAAVVGGE